MGEMILHYSDLTSAGTQLSALSDELTGQLPIWGCETGEVDINGAINVLQVNATAIRDQLGTMQLATVEILNEVNTVDENGATRFAAHLPLVEVAGSMVNDNVPGAGAPPPGIIPGGTPVGPQHLDLPPNLQPRAGK